ncbi:hypothetical protein [Paludisphaera sp.]|uniref:hypothetical protein n=1 Tax=Paludisphaera sp. TaxID=2017432 RepID=UPI00301E2B38
MMDDAQNDPKPPAGSFDFSAYPPNTVFHERREGKDRRDAKGRAAKLVEAPVDARPPRVVERREKKERRKRIDPTTFEKQYTDDELEFMNAMQRFKELSGKSFPTYAEVIKVAVNLGYRKVIDDTPPPVFDEQASLLLFTRIEQEA